MGIGGEGGTFSSAIICSVYHVVPLVLFNLCLFTWNPRRYRMKARSQWAQDKLEHQPAGFSSQRSNHPNKQEGEPRGLYPVGASQRNQPSTLGDLGSLVQDNQNDDGRGSQVQRRCPEEAGVLGVGKKNDTAKVLYWYTEKAYKWKTRWPGTGETMGAAQGQPSARILSWARSVSWWGRAAGAMSGYLTRWCECTGSRSWPHGCGRSPPWWGSRPSRKRRTVSRASAHAAKCQAPRPCWAGGPRPPCSSCWSRRRPAHHTPWRF